MDIGDSATALKDAAIWSDGVVREQFLNSIITEHYQQVFKIEQLENELLRLKKFSKMQGEQLRLCAAIKSPATSLPAGLSREEKRELLATPPP